MSAKKIHTRKTVLLLFLFTGLSLCTTAAKRYWISSATSGWNTTANWSATSGGSGGSSVPGANDTCYFDGNGLGRCDIDANVSVRRFEIVSTYTDTITQNAYTITAGAGGMSMAGGVFIGSSSAITSGSTFSNSGCKFTSTSGTLEILSGHFYLSGTGAFVHNSGLLKFSNTAGTAVDTSRIDISTSSADTNFYNMEMNVGSGRTRFFKLISGTIRVENNLTASGTGVKNIGSGIIELLGNYNVSSAGIFRGSGGSLGTATLKLCGTGDQYLNGHSAIIVGSQLVNIDLNKASGTLYLTGYLNTHHNWNLSNGSMNAGTSILNYAFSSTTYSVTGNFTGSNAFHKVVYQSNGSGGLVINDTLQINDSLIFVGTALINKGTNAGILCAKKNVRANTNATNHVFGTATLLLNGTGTQVIRSMYPYGGSLSNCLDVIIQKSASDTLKLLGYIAVYKNWTYISGRVISDQARIMFRIDENPTITGTDTLSSVEFGSYNGGGTLTIASGTVLTINDTLWRTGNGAANLINTGVINLWGHLYLKTSSGTANGGTATLKINGGSDQHIYGYTTAGVLGRLPNTEINKPGGTLFLHDKIAIGSTGTALNFTLTQGTIDAGNSTFIFANNCSISHAPGKKIELNDVQFTIGTITIDASDTLRVKGNFSTSANSSALVINGGILECRGNITLGNINTVAAAGSATLLINGSGTQVFTGSGIAGAGYVPKVQINKASGTLELSSIISAANHWEYIVGNVDASKHGSKVHFLGTVNLDAQGSSSAMEFHDLTIGGAITLNGNMAAVNNLVINSSRTLAQGSYDLTFGGYTNNGTHSGTGAISFVGSGYHDFIKSGGGTTSFGTVTVNRGGGSLRLKSPVNITGSLTLTEGILKTDSVNLLKFADNATCTGGSDTGFVRGPVMKTGDEAFEFPLGDTIITNNGYRPLSITAPSSSGDAYTARYFHSPAPNANALPDTIQSVSPCEYWTLMRNAGSSNIKTAVWWSEADCPAYAYDAIEIANYDSTASKWISLGGVIADNDSLDGLMRIKAVNNVSFTLIGPIIIGIIKKLTPGYAVVERSYTSGYYLTVNKVLNFEYFEDYNDADQKLSYRIKRVSTDKTELDQQGYIMKVVQGTNRYRMNLNTISPGTFTSGYYLLEITNEKQEKFYLRFKI